MTRKKEFVIPPLQRQEACVVLKKNTTLLCETLRLFVRLRMSLATRHFWLLLLLDSLCCKETGGSISSNGENTEHVIQES